jgi:hypothetical protein
LYTDSGLGDLSIFFASLESLFAEQWLNVVTAKYRYSVLARFADLGLAKDLRKRLSITMSARRI